QQLPQTALRPGARLVALARVKPEAALDAQVMALEPAGKTRQIVRVERRHGFRRITFRRTKAAIVPALEQHHAIGPEAPARQGLAETLRHGAEILADDNATRGQTLLRN